MFSTEQDHLTGIDVVLITHEHGDHFHTESVKQIVANNPQAVIISNSAVGAKLKELGISYTLLEGQNQKEINGLNFEAFDCKHEEIFENFGQVQNTGYLIGNKLYYPGDSFKAPEKKIEILALPVAGPWCKISDAIRFTLKVKPTWAFPVHDAVLQPHMVNGLYKITETILKDYNIGFKPLSSGEEKEF